MKTLVLFIITLSLNAFAHYECKLDTPIHVGNLNLLDGLTLNEVQFFETVKFTEPSAYDPSKDRLTLSLFEIEHDHDRSGFLGAGVQVKNGTNFDSIGFTQVYIGNFDFKGSILDHAGVVTYNTRSGHFYTDPQHAKNEAITEVLADVANGYLVSLRLTHPHFKVWKEEGPYKYIAFTGLNQTLCLKKARN